MTLMHLIILAIVQGLTEFIPVSSSAHLILAPLFVEGWDDQGRAIDVAAHVGSLFAVLIYFRTETGRLFVGAFDTVRFQDTANRKLFLLIAVATIPLVLFGAFLALTGLADAMRDPRVLGAASIFFGILLWVADRKPSEKSEMPSTWKSILFIGGAQALALIPGTSRSGATITAARWLGFNREESARFSMLLAIPAITISGLYVTLELLQEGSGATFTSALLVAIFSFIAALIAIAVFMRLTKSMSFTPFVIYRILLGVLLLIMFS